MLPSSALPPRSPCAAAGGPAPRRRRSSLGSTLQENPKPPPLSRAATGVGGGGGVGGALTQRLAPLSACTSHSFSLFWQTSPLLTFCFPLMLGSGLSRTVVAIISIPDCNGHSRNAGLRSPYTRPKRNEGHSRCRRSSCYQNTSRCCLTQAKLLLPFYRQVKDRESESIQPYVQHQWLANTCAQLPAQRALQLWHAPFPSSTSARKPYEVGYIFLVPPKGHQVYTLTNISKEPYIHSPKTEI